MKVGCLNCDIMCRLWLSGHAAVMGFEPSLPEGESLMVTRFLIALMVP